MSIKENFEYPIDVEWNNQEITDVINFFADIEASFRKGIKKQKLEESYQKFKKVVPNQSEERRIFREFLKNSGMEPFLAIKQLKDDSVKTVKV